MPQVAHTCAARAGVIYLSKTVAIEGLNGFPDGVPERFALTNPMKRFVDVLDVAEAVVYVGADSGKFVTGEVVMVDGGHSAWGDTEWPGGKPEYFRSGQ